MRFLPAVISGLALAFLTHSAHAFTLPANWDVPICGSAGCAGGGGIVALETYVRVKIVNAMGIAFVGVAAIMLFIYATSLVVQSEDENRVKEIRTGYAYAITGAALVALAHFLVSAFSPNANTAGVIVSTAPLQSGFGQVITYFKLVLAIVLIVNIVIQAVLLIGAPSEETSTRAKKQLLFGFIGVAIVLLANAMVSAVDKDNVLGGTGTAADITLQIVGVANFLLSIFGLLAVAALIVAGVMLVISVEETLKDKAKMIVKTTIISLAVVLGAFIIVNTFLAIPL